MDSQAEHKKNKKTYHNHACPRHRDLTILLHAANKKVCNSCFATLKKSYFNVIAGLLLEEHYLHNVTNGLVRQNNILQKQIDDQQQHLLNLSAEITEIKNNGRSHENSRPEPSNRSIPDPSPQAKNQPTSNAQETHSTGHVAKVAHSLQNLLHIQIARIMLSWRKDNAKTTPKSDDLQDSGTTTHAPPGELIK